MIVAPAVTAKLVICRKNDGRYSGSEETIEEYEAMMRGGKGGNSGLLGVGLTEGVEGL